MKAVSAIGLRAERRRCQLRALRKYRELTCIANRSQNVALHEILAFVTVRNELIRLPYFLKYYRDLGVGHFFFVDNGSSDGTQQFLADQPDVSVWHTEASYKRSRFGTEWLNGLKWHYATGHWTLTLDPDEFLIYPFWTTRPIPALCEWLDQSGARSFGTMLLDMYPRQSLGSVKYKSGQNPFEIAEWFDSGNYMTSKNPRYGNLWIQGGVRARSFFPTRPDHAPSLNKIPLVKWERRCVYVNSTHMLLPRGLNLTYAEDGGEKTSGLLLHAKFLDLLAEKAEEEKQRREHFAKGREYDAYHAAAKDRNVLWWDWSEKYIDWTQLEMLGLMSKGNWA